MQSETVESVLDYFRPGNVNRPYLGPLSLACLMGDSFKLINRYLGGI